MQNRKGLYAVRVEAAGGMGQGEKLKLGKQKAGALGEVMRNRGESPPGLEAWPPEFRTKVMNGKV